jgi:6-phosphogluconolactonase
MAQSAPLLRLFDDPDQLARGAGDEFARRARRAQDAGGRFAVALSGGSTPGRLYRTLAGPSFRDQVEWAAVHFFWGDERTVPPDHPDSNFAAAREALLSRVPVPPENIHRIKGEQSDPARAAADYEEELRRFFRLGPGGLPRFDLVLLGLGADGHTASLFPGSDALTEGRRLVVAPWVEKLDTHRVTLTCPVLNNAACILFLVTGVRKAATLRRVLEGPRDPRYPAQRVRPHDGELLWYVDRAAARELRPESGTSLA